MQERLSLNRAAFDAVRQGYRPGMTEKDIKNIICEAWAKGSDRDIEFSGDVIAGVRTAAIEGDATDYVLQEGDALLLDLQPGWDHFWCDTTRTFFVGKASDEQRRVFGAITHTISAIETILRPGTRACEIYRKMQETLAVYGFSCPHHAGHATGHEKVAFPTFVEECDAPLEKGMYIALEPGVYLEDFGIRLENNYLITENGFEKLFDYTLDINNFII